MAGPAIVCCFDSTGDLVGEKHTYKALKALVLKVGRFSVFEASANERDAKMFTRLCSDLEIETFDLGFPWTGVRRRDEWSAFCAAWDRIGESTFEREAARKARSGV